MMYSYSTYFLIYSVHGDMEGGEPEAGVYAGEVGEGEGDDATGPRKVRK